MPAGAVHYEYWKRGLYAAVPGAAIGVIIGILYQNLYLVEFWMWWLFWYWMGRYIDPDWDQAGITAAEGRMRRELGLLSLVIFPVTAFYAELVGHLIDVLNIKGAIGGTHRTWLTHSLVPGTVIRQVVVCLCLALALNLTNEALAVTFGGSLNFAAKDLHTFYFAMFAGLGTTDLIHILLDKYYGGE